MSRYFLFGTGFIIGFIFVYSVCLMFKSSSNGQTNVQETIVEVKAKTKEDRSYEEAISLAKICHYGPAVNHDEALVYYLEAENKGRSRYERGECAMARGSLWEAANPPNLTRAIAAYLDAWESGYEDGVLRIAHLYAHGAHPHYLPDKVEALRIYRELEYVSPTLKPWCKFGQNDLSNIRYDPDSVPQQGRVYQALPTGIVRAIMERMRYPIVVPCTKAAPVLLPSLPDHNEEDTILDMFERDIVAIAPSPPVVHNDMQNVHDHTLQNLAEQNLTLSEKSLLSTTGTQKTNAREELYAMNLTDSARKVLDSLTNMPHSRFERSEKEVLNAVWARIHSPENEANRDELIRSLMENLDSGVEHGYVVCSTGKIMRMLSTLEVLDQKAEIMRPEWAIRQEIGETVGKILRSRLETAPEATREAYEALEPSQEQTELADKLRDRVREEVRRTCAADYKDTVDSERLALYVDANLEYI